MGARENILKRLKTASDSRQVGAIEEPDWETPIYLEQGKKLAENFKKHLELVAGTVQFCDDLNDAASKIQEILKEQGIEKPFLLDKNLQKAFDGKIHFSSEAADFESMQAGITPCEFLVAHLGSVLVSSGSDSGRRLHVFPETHIIVAHSNQLVNYLDDGIEQLQRKYRGNLPSSITNITGPSRTADIEKTLVMGMHGPRKLFVVLCDKPF